MSDSEEHARLRKLHKFALLGTESNAAFDAITRIAVNHFNVPMSVISLVDGEHQWFKSSIGLSMREMGREYAFCAQTIKSSDLLVVPDTVLDPHFVNNPLVTGEPLIRFYAGAPLLTDDGYALGGLSIIDHKPREMSVADRRMLRDLATLVMEQANLLHAVEHTDRLTGLPNRAQFMLDVERSVPTLSRRSLVMIEPMTPKTAEQQAQTLGVGFTDTLLSLVVDIIERHVGTHCRLYQFDSTQFFFELSQTSTQTVVDIVNPLITELRMPLPCNDIPMMLRAYAGIVPDIPYGQSGDDQLRMVQSAVQHARLKDRPWSIYQADVDVAWRRSARLLTEIPIALQRDAFRLVFQPRVNLASGCCTGAEALLRWTHSELGNVSPAEFIPLIEHTSMIHPISDWVIRSAVRQAGQWMREGLSICVSINISAENLTEEDLVDRLNEAMRHEAIPPSMLELEITEGSLLHNSPAARQRLQELTNLGLRIAIDDFGTGYSNLANLRYLPAKVLKLDQSLIRSLAEDSSSRVIVKSTLAMAHELGFGVVAEGVENEAALNLLVKWQCDEAQGFFIARPLEAKALPQWIEKWNTRHLRAVTPK